MAGMALALLPKPLTAQSRVIETTFVGVWDESENIDLHLTLYEDAILKFSENEAFRTITLEIRKEHYDENGSYLDKYTSIMKAAYTMAEPPKLVDAENSTIYQVEADLLEVTTNEPNMVFEHILFQVNLEKVPGVVALPIGDRTIILEEAETFICTACMRAKGLSRNCEELQTLRSFRSEYAMRTSEGRNLIRQYAIVGPLMVQKIENSANREEIYAAVYKTLVLPAIDLIRAGRKETAMHFYKEYMKGLKEKMNV